MSEETTLRPSQAAACVFSFLPFHEKNKYGSVQELRSTFSHIKSIYLDFSLVWFECGLVSSYVGWMGQNKADVTNTHTPKKNDMMTC